MKPLIILTGPTAVGKTDLSIKLAKAVNGEIISADSIQVYKELNIGSAKITPEEMQGIKHYLIDELSPEEEFNVMYFKEKANEYINQILENGHLPIVTGGTGFYIQSVLYDIDFKETECNNSYREELEMLYKEHGAEYLHNMLKEIDKEYAQTVHYNNVKRVMRAIEFYKQTGVKMSTQNETQRARKSDFNFKYYVLNDDRPVLYERINKRVDIMMQDGLEEEVISLKNKGYTKDMLSMQGIGYREMFDYLDGLISKEEAIDLIKKNTRHFAKRQLTWFRREKDVTMINLKEFNHNQNEILQYMIMDLKKSNILN